MDTHNVQNLSRIQKGYGKDTPKGCENPNKVGFNLTAQAMNASAKRIIPESEKLQTVEFPLQVFPEKLQRIVKETKSKKQFPIDFTGTSIMFALSVAMGNSFEYNALNYSGKASFWFANVGGSGVNKTSPMSFALNPIEKRNESLYNKYRDEASNYEANLRLSKDDQDDSLSKPVLRKHLLTDFTPETLAFVHQNNPKGLGVHADELKSWFGNFNRYNSGAVTESWLSGWSQQSHSIDRKNENIYFSNPFVSVCGGIQPSVLQDLTKNGNANNGFLHRILFTYPTDVIPEYPSLEGIDYNAYVDYERIINHLLDTPYSETPQTLHPDPDAKAKLYAYKCELIDLQRDANDEMNASQNSKLQIYLFRFALLFEGMFFACGESEMKSISLRAVEASIATIEYFKNSGERVYDILQNPENKIFRLPQNKQSIYTELPNEFKTNDAVQVGEKYGLKKSAIEKFLRKSDFFTSISHGRYSKVLG